MRFAFLVAVKKYLMESNSEGIRASYNLRGAVYNDGRHGSRRLFSGISKKINREKRKRNSGGSSRFFSFLFTHPESPEHRMVPLTHFMVKLLTWGMFSWNDPTKTPRYVFPR